MKDPEWFLRIIRSLARNKNLKYVRTIAIDPPFSTSHGFRTAFTEFLHNLQNNALTRFKYDNLGPLTHAHLKYLWQHQKNLRNIQIDFKLYSTREPNILDEDAPILQSLSLLSELDINLSWSSKNTARRLLKMLNLSRLQKLMISKSLENGWPRCVTISGTFLTDHSLSTLTHLTLHLIDFDAQEPLQLGSFSSLTHLSVWLCENMSIFASYEKPILKSLCFLGNCSEDSLEDELVYMLHRFQGLETLALHIRQTIRSKTAEYLRAAIAKHSDTLKHLLIEVDEIYPRSSDSVEDLMDSELFETIKMCKHISQLRLSMDVRDVVENCVVEKYKVNTPGNSTHWIDYC